MPYTYTGACIRVSCIVLAFMEDLLLLSFEGEVFNHIIGISISMSINTDIYFILVMIRITLHLQIYLKYCLQFPD